MTDLVAVAAVPPDPGPRDELVVAALGQMAECTTPPVAGPSAETAIIAVHQNRLRRVPGGRSRQVIVRLSTDEHDALQRRAADAGVSVQRYLVEAGLSGVAGDGATRRRAERELIATRGAFRAVGNNLNQLAKWANANHALPSHIEATLAQVGTATDAVSERLDQMAAAFEASL